MAEAIALFVFIAAIAFWWHLAARQKRKRLMQPSPRNERRRFHCVEIRSSTAACEAVQCLSNKRFLSDEAPLLPLPECDAQQCNCSFIHFDDRRQHDRRNPYGLLTGSPPAETAERRSRRDRRKPMEPAFRPSIAR